MKDERVHPLPGLVFEEGFDDGVHGVDVPRLIHKMDSSEAGGETVLRGGDRRSHHISPQTCPQQRWPPHEDKLSYIVTSSAK